MSDMNEIKSDVKDDSREYVNRGKELLNNNRQTIKKNAGTALNLAVRYYVPAVLSLTAMYYLMQRASYKGTSKALGEFAQGMAIEVEKFSENVNRADDAVTKSITLMDRVFAPGGVGPAT